MSIRLQGPRRAELICRSSLPVAAMNRSSLAGVLGGEDGIAFLSHSKKMRRHLAHGIFENAWRDDLEKSYKPPPGSPTHSRTDWLL